MIKTIVSIVCGKKDNANLKASRQLKVLLPQSELHIISGAGHEVNKSAPEAVSDIVRKIFKKISTHLLTVLTTCVIVRLEHGKYEEVAL